LSQFFDEWAALEMKCGETRYLAVWRREDGNSIQRNCRLKTCAERKGRPSGSTRCRVLTGMNGMQRREACVEFPRENMAALYRL